MSNTLLISELAARSGFTPSALRYYEQVGLLAATERSSGGYRLYDESALVRLRFIDRAKQLGLPLEEIRVLVGIWDLGQCAHVRDTLRARIAARSAEVRTRIQELNGLDAQLQAGGADLEGRAPAGSCGDDCGCAPERSAPGNPQPIELSLTLPERALDPRRGVGARGTGPPVDLRVACALTADDQPARLAEWNELLALAETRTAVEGGVRVQFPHDPVIAGRLGDLAVREQACCSFFTFTLRLDSEGITLDLLAPEDALGVVRELFGASS